MLLDGIGLTAAGPAVDLFRPSLAAAPVLDGQEALLPVVDSADLEDLGMAVSLDVAGAASWIDFNTSDGLSTDQAAQVEVIRSDNDGIFGQITVPGAWLESTTVGENSFAQLSIPGTGFTDVIGAPRLPVVRSLLAIPDGVEVTARIDGQPHLLSTIDIGIGRSLAPLQTSVPKLAGALEAAPLDYGLLYATDRFLPDTGVRVLEAGYSHGQRLVMLEVAPIAYNPAAGLL
ncbi:MAG TPA: C25 family peptidase propeptide domain-containing protein, partial [Thermoguttaceae bacterium]|nr:C25 family peptidase propeptide domain-containing protein [Thermoguttaceae bacterium]